MIVNTKYKIADSKNEFELGIYHAADADADYGDGDGGISIERWANKKKKKKKRSLETFTLGIWIIREETQGGWRWWFSSGLHAMTI